MKDRIQALDGVRGLAILLVASYHAYARWAELVPYGDSVREFPLFKFGWLGVELFFLISGFVILMTLERCSNAQQFLYRRWLRLFPTMLICSLLIYFTAPLFKERPAGAPTVESLLPGLTFIDSTWWSKITGHAIAPIEGAFWSLFVEVKFYFFAALVFYWSGRNILILFLIASFAAAIFFRTLPNYFNPFLLPYINSLIRDASFEYFGWFASGAAFYVFFRNGTFSWLALASAMALLSSLTSRGLHWQPFIAGSLISLSFALAVISPTAQYILRLRLFQFLGLVSYPLYLIHENILISLIIKGGRFMSPEQSLYIPVLSLALLSIAAYFITQYLEPRVKQIIVKSSNFIGRQRA